MDVGKPLRPAKLERLRKSQVLMTRIFARHKAGRERHLARLPSALLPCQSDCMPDWLLDPRVRKLPFTKLKQFLASKGVDEEVCAT